MSDSLARKLRRNATDAEKILWQALRARQLAGLKFRRQYPVGGYVADFVCLDHHLIVEVDGSQHADESPRRRQDLEAMGFLVIRFWNNEVLENLDGVLIAIKETIGRS